ncbi:MAG: histone family protein [Methanomicrobiales archaeon]|nr:histone family protein [Methanomicrobiales archaeon]
MTEIPLSPMGRLMKKAGAERVSADARETLAALLEEYALVLAREAVKLSIHAGRKTVTEADLRMAFDLLR